MANEETLFSNKSDKKIIADEMVSFKDGISYIIFDG